MQGGHQRRQPSEVSFPLFHCLQLWPAALHSRQRGTSSNCQEDLDAVQAHTHTHTHTRTCSVMKTRQLMLAQGATQRIAAQSTLQHAQVQIETKLPKLLQHVHCSRRLLTKFARQPQQQQPFTAAERVEQPCSLRRKIACWSVGRATSEASQDFSSAFTAKMD